MKGQFTRSRTGIKISLIDTNSQSISRNWVTILGVCTEFGSYSTLRNFVEFCYNKASITYVTIPRQTIGCGKVMSLIENVPCFKVRN